MHPALAPCSHAWQRIGPIQLALRPVNPVPNSAPSEPSTPRRPTAGGTAGGGRPRAALCRRVRLPQHPGKLGRPVCLPLEDSSRMSQAWHSTSPRAALRGSDGRPPHVCRGATGDRRRPLTATCLPACLLALQGLMRKVKLGRCEYDYVEVMACPSGGKMHSVHSMQRTAACPLTTCCDVRGGASQGRCPRASICARLSACPSVSVPRSHRHAAVQAA